LIAKLHHSVLLLLFNCQRTRLRGRRLNP